MTYDNLTMTNEKKGVFGRCGNIPHPREISFMGEWGILLVCFAAHNRRDVHPMAINNRVFITLYIVSNRKNDTLNEALIKPGG